MLAYALGNGSVKLTWTCDPAASSYQFRQGLTPTDLRTVYGNPSVLQVTGCQHTFTGLTPNVPHFFEVGAGYQNPHGFVKSPVVGILVQ